MQESLVKGFAFFFNLQIIYTFACVSSCCCHSLVIDMWLMHFLFPICQLWSCKAVSAVERLPALHYSADFIFLYFWIMGFIVEL